MALPRALAAGIRFDPVLPADHALLIHQVPAGTEIKMVAVYDEPFWRHDGVSGATVATDDEIEVTLDTSQPGHAHGVIAGYCGRAAGPRPGRADRDRTPLGRVRHDADHPPRTRRRHAPRGPGAELGRGALDPRAAPWATSRPGVLTQYGRRLREPVGRVHWAGTETASTSYGAMDGAVRSGERVCEEILHAAS